MALEQVAQGAPAAPVRLAFGTTFRAAFAVIFARPWQFVKVAALPLLAGVTIVIVDLSLRAATAVGAVAVDPEGLVVALMEMAVGLAALLPFAALGIGVARQRLLGTGATVQPLPSPLRRTLLYAGYLLLLTMIFVLAMVGGFFGGLFLLEAMNAGDDASVTGFIGGGIVGLCLVLYLLLRLSLVFPAVSLGQKLGLVGSWRLTRGSGLKLLGVFLLLFLTLAVAIVVGSAFTGTGEIQLGTEFILPDGLGAPSDWTAVLFANLPRNLWNLVANFILFAAGCGAMASAYAQLSGWGAPRQEILERFE
jgi:hypothetical protein